MPASSAVRHKSRTNSVTAMEYMNSRWPSHYTSHRERTKGKRVRSLTIELVSEQRTCQIVFCSFSNPSHGPPMGWHEVELVRGFHAINVPRDHILFVLEFNLPDDWPHEQVIEDVKNRDYSWLDRIAMAEGYAIWVG